MRSSPFVRRRVLAPMVLAGLITSAAGCGAASGDSPPDFTLRDTEGEKFTLSTLRGKPVVLNFWFLG